MLRKKDVDFSRAISQLHNAREEVQIQIHRDSSEAVSVSIDKYIRKQKHGLKVNSCKVDHKMDSARSYDTTLDLRIEDTNGLVLSKKEINQCVSRNLEPDASRARANGVIWSDTHERAYQRFKRTYFKSQENSLKRVHSPSLTMSIFIANREFIAADIYVKRFRMLNELQARHERAQSKRRAILEQRRKQGKNIFWLNVTSTKPENDSEDVDTEDDRLLPSSLGNDHMQPSPARKSTCHKSLTI